MSEQQIEKKSLTDSGKNQSDLVEIDLKVIFRKIIAIRKTLYKAAGVGLIIGVVVALSIPKRYTVTVTLSPEMVSSKGGGGIAGLAASFLGSGASANDGSDALNVSLSSDIIASTPFLMELLTMHISVIDMNNRITLATYLDTQSSPWWSYIIGLPGKALGGVRSLFGKKRKETFKNTGRGAIKLSQEQSNKINVLRKSITAVVNNKTAITKISVTLQNPEIAAIVADSVVHKLQECIISYRTSKVKEDCAYLTKLLRERQQEYYIAQKKYADYVDTHDNLVLQSVRTEQERLQNDMSLAYQVYSQVANQLQVARAKVQEEKPVFALVEPAVVPLYPSGMGMTIYVMIFIFISVSGTILWKLIILS